MYNSILVIGAGSWGTALALVLARNKHRVHLLSTNDKNTKNKQTSNHNKSYFSSVTASENLYRVALIDDVPKDIKYAVIAVPCRGLRDSLKLLTTFSGIQVCLACKGFEANTQKLNHIVVKEVLQSCPVAIISGPSFAKEVVEKKPTAVTIAAEDIKIAENFAAIFHNEIFRIYTSDDYIGVQIGGAVKNVMAIATGIVDGLKFGANTRSALITRGLSEIIRLGLSMGAKKETFMGLAGLGDLILTCTDNQSRNRSFGLLLAQGINIDEARKQIGQAIEGIGTVAEVVKLATKYNIEMPITEQVNNVLKGVCSPHEAVQNLLTRKPKSEKN